MPRSPPWHFTYVDEKSPHHGVFVVSGNNVLSKYGKVNQLQKCNDDIDKLRVIFDETDQPRKLLLSTFSWDANSFCRNFQGAKSIEAFISKFNELLSESHQAIASQASSASPPSKRPRVLMPASQEARMSSISSTEDDMDKAVVPFFLGNFLLPIRCLQQPPPHLLIRKINARVVAILKQEMLQNLCVDVQPMLCIVQLLPGQVFDENLKEGYSYFTIGGNHSRAALQELLDEMPQLEQNKQYTHRNCAVYTSMDTLLAKRLASKHNYAATNSHEMTTWDWIVQCRELLYTLSKTSPDKEPPSLKPENWKKMCASVLALTATQLDERMIYFLAALKCESFHLLEKIYELHSEGKLKNQVVSRSKKGINSFPDLKGSTFKPFRGLSANTVHELLQQVRIKESSIKEVVSQCNDIKALQKIQAAFVKATNVDNWEDAVAKFPNYTTSHKLEPFKSLNFNDQRKVPPQFLRFCQQAMVSSRADNDCDGEKDDDNVFQVEFNGVKGIIWKHIPLSINPESFAGLRLTACPGFSLAIIDLASRQPSLLKEHDCARICEDAKQYAVIVRALNYSMGMTDFTTICFCSVLQMQSVLEVLQRHSDFCQVAVCASPSTKKETNCKKLNETVFGVVICQNGSPLSLPECHDNYFIHAMDAFVIDCATNHVVYEGQKPLELFIKLLQLFSKEGDWIYYAPSGVGTSLIASMQSKRNTVTVEKNDVNFIQMKIHIVEKLGKLDENMDNTSNIIEDSNNEEIE